MFWEHDRCFLTLQCGRLYRQTDDGLQYDYAG